ncbi:MAG: hypothetical protein ABI603_02720 [Acidobacteriota bacterium]
MTPRQLVCAALGLAVLCRPEPAAAQKLQLSIAPSVITFPSSDPDAVPVIAAAPVTITYRVQQNNTGTWSLTVLAAGDLIAGPATVDISNVTWVATPAPPFQNGTLNKTIAQRVAAGVGNANPTAIGSLTFRLVNSWTYSTGIYTQTVLFTLSAP